MELIGMRAKWTQLLNMCLDLKTLVQLYSNWVNFTGLKLELWMFIACDKEGNVLEEPIPLGYHEEENIYEWNEKEVKQYQEAKERVIFEGCYAIKHKDYYSIEINDYGIIWLSWNESKTIEDLTSLGLTITPQAIKKYNLT